MYETRIWNFNILSKKNVKNSQCNCYAESTKLNTDYHVLITMRS